MIAHLSGLLTVPIGLTLLGPLTIYLVFRNRGAFVREQAAEALNFQILVDVVVAAALLLTAVSFGVAAFATVPLLLLGGIGALVLMALGATRANVGTPFRYPVSWRLVR